MFFPKLWGECVTIVWPVWRCRDSNSGPHEPESCDHDMKARLKPSHANWLEAFSFTIVGEMPDGAKPWPYVPSAIMDAKKARSVYGDGSFGGAYRALESVMQEMFTACLQDVVRLLAFD